MRLQQLRLLPAGSDIEEVAGRTYEDYVREEVFKPMEISGMRIGKSLLKDRAPGETRYYLRGDQVTGGSLFGPELGKPVPRPYGSFCIDAMDAHGGWIGSSVDLARFATALDVDSKYKVFLPGSSSALLRRHDRVNATILVNKRDDTQRNPNLAQQHLDDHLHRLIDSVAIWPRGNLFPKFVKAAKRKA